MRRGTWSRTAPVTPDGRVVFHGLHSECAPPFSVRRSPMVGMVSGGISRLASFTVRRPSMPPSSNWPRPTSISSGPQVRSPVNGYVTNLLMRVGDYALAGTNNISVIDADSYWIDGYFEE